VKTLRSFAYAGRGFLGLLRAETNFRIEMAVAECVFAGLILLGFPRLITAFAVLMTGLVLSAEAVNTAVEKALDALGERRGAIGRAKDAAASAVLLLAAASLVLGVWLAWPLRSELAHRASQTPVGLILLAMLVALTLFVPAVRSGRGRT